MSDARPIGQPRGVAIGLRWFRAVKAHEELQIHSGQGAGGVLGFLIVPAIARVVKVQSSLDGYREARRAPGAA